MCFATLATRNDEDDEILPGELTGSQKFYANTSFGCAITFWSVLFIMTNFIYLYLSMQDFSISDGVWYAIVIIFVGILALSYIGHLWFDCLAFDIAAPGDEDADDDKEDA